MTNKNKRALILLSGGMDSATSLAIAKEQGFELFALSLDYSQRHKVELQAARALAEKFAVAQHHIFKVDLSQIGGSALTDNISVPKQSLGVDAIPITYVPARNTIFLSIALAFAERYQASHIFIGANAVDYSGYPDCRPEFLLAFENVANLGTKIGVEGNFIHIEAPLLKLSKAEIIKMGTRLGVDYSLTISCYDPNSDGKACASCDACLLRKKGFLEADLSDPTSYA